jgi:hypothetical protein
MEFELKKILIGLACTLALSAAHAGDTGGIRGLVGVGLTFGGDQVGDTIGYTNGDTAKIHAGGLADLRGGIEYQLQGQPVAIELSIGYHFDKANAKNGDVSFTRFPLELIAHYAVNEYWRVGLGMRKSLSTESSSSGVGAAYVPNSKYKSSVAPLIEAEYFMTPQFSFKGRYVSESFKPENGGKKLDGSHGGIYGMFYF